MLIPHETNLISKPKSQTKHPKEFGSTKKSSYTSEGVEHVWTRILLLNPECCSSGAQV
jgi:hypothetical protein